MKHLGPLVLLTLTCALPCTAIAQGQLAFTARTVNVRAGPATDYPIVAVVPPGFEVGVQGCLPDYSWCDVIAGESRGWVFGGNINYAYQNTYVPVLNYGPVIGIGILTFVLSDYWGRHYRHRSFYGERHRWSNRPAPAPRFRPPPTAGVIGPRPALPHTPHPHSVVPGAQPSNPPPVQAAPVGPPRQGTAVRRRPPQEGHAPGAESGRHSPHGDGAGRGPDQRR